MNHEHKPRQASAILLWTSLFVLAVSTTLRANPVGGVVIHGDASITPDGSILSIEQLSDRAIIHWDKFSIDAGELTRFIQPGKGSAVLNRVVTGDPSAIHGALQANGRVLLINPNGILIGPTGSVDTGGGFIASTLDLPDAQFLAGGDLRFSGDSTAAVTNLGSIVSESGDVLLLGGGDVVNAGSIDAPNGVAGLASGARILVKSSGDERIFVEIGSAAGKVDHSGTIRAAQAELKAAGSSTESLAVNMSGIVEATAVTRSGGRIFLNGGNGGVNVSGTLKARTVTGDGGQIDVRGGSVTTTPTAEIDASGGTGGTVVIDSESRTRIGGRLLANGTGNVGGSIQVTGATVTLDDSAFADASGATGGGEIRVGGGYQGNEPGIRNARTTRIAPGARLVADSLLSGNAGRIIVWADGDTLYHGDISAAARGATGDGGFVEVSGKSELAYRGTTDVSTLGGDPGTLLLDPGILVIINGLAGAAANSAALADGVIDAADGGAATYTVTTGDIAAVGGNVALAAQTLITDNGVGAFIENPSGDISMMSGGDINLAMSTVSAPGNNVNLNAPSGLVDVDTVNTASFFSAGIPVPGIDGGDIDITGNTVVVGSAISGGIPGDATTPDGSNGGDITINSATTIGGDQFIAAGGAGHPGSTTQAGGNGGNSGFINFVAGFPISVGKVNVKGGDAGDGNPPGTGGASPSYMAPAGSFITELIEGPGDDGVELIDQPGDDDDALPNRPFKPGSPPPRSSGALVASPVLANVPNAEEAPPGLDNFVFSATTGNVGQVTSTNLTTPPTNDFQSETRSVNRKVGRSADEKSTPASNRNVDPELVSTLTNDPAGNLEKPPGLIDELRAFLGAFEDPGDFEDPPPPKVKQFALGLDGRLVEVEEGDENTPRSVVQPRDVIPLPGSIEDPNAYILGMYIGKLNIAQRHLLARLRFSQIVMPDDDPFFGPPTVDDVADEKETRDDVVESLKGYLKGLEEERQLERRLAAKIARIDREIEALKKENPEGASARGTKYARIRMLNELAAREQVYLDRARNDQLHVARHVVMLFDLLNDIDSNRFGLGNENQKNENEKIRAEILANVAVGFDGTTENTNPDVVEVPDAVVGEDRFSPGKLKEFRDRIADALEAELGFDGRHFHESMSDDMLKRGLKVLDKLDAEHDDPGFSDYLHFNVRLYFSETLDERAQERASSR